MNPNIQSSSFMIIGEGLEMFGLQYRLNGMYPVIGAIGVLTNGFVWNVDESWAPVVPPITSLWTLSFGVTGTSWTQSFGVTGTAWTLSF